MSNRTPQENLIAILNSGDCKLFVCPLCLDTSTNAVPCYGRGHPEAEVVRVGPWGEGR